MTPVSLFIMFLRSEYLFAAIISCTSSYSASLKSIVLQIKGEPLLVKTICFRSKGSATAAIMVANILQSTNVEIIISASTLIKLYDIISVMPVAIIEANKDTNVELYSLFTNTLWDFIVVFIFFLL